MGGSVLVFLGHRFKSTTRKGFGNRGSVRNGGAPGFAGAEGRRTDPPFQDAKLPEGRLSFELRLPLALNVDASRVDRRSACGGGQLGERREPRSRSGSGSPLRCGARSRTSRAGWRRATPRSSPPREPRSSSFSRAPPGPPDRSDPPAADPGQGSAAGELPFRREGIVEVVPRAGPAQRFNPGGAGAGTRTGLPCLRFGPPAGPRCPRPFERCPRHP